MSKATNSSTDANASFLDRQKSRWVPDALSTACARCGAQWTVFRRKHHCRRCFQVYCDSCCSCKVVLPGYGTEPQRVCKICEAILSGSTVTATIGADGRIIQTSSMMNAGQQQQQQSPPGSGSQTASPSSAASGPSSSRGRAGESKLEDRSGASNNNNSNKPLPSLECFPRERRVLLVGSAGVGKGSFVQTACGLSSSPYSTSAGAAAAGVGSSSSAPQQQQQQQQAQHSSHYHMPLSPEASLANPGFDGQQQPSGASGGGGGSAATERRRLFPFQGQLYSLTLVNTSGSTVSSDLFVHPLLTIGTAAYVLMYDVTEPKSFELLPLLYERLLDCGAGDKAVVLLGSKADHVSQTGAGRDRVVPKDTAQRLAKLWGAPHVDCTCTSKDSVDYALAVLLHEIAQRDTF